MLDANEDAKTLRAETIPVTHHNRIVLMLVAFCCLSAGIAIGTILKGIAGAGSEDNRLTISNGSVSPDILSAAFARVAEQVEPSVVNITVREGEGAAGFARDGTGSGIIVNPSGFIITNQHVIRRATKIKVRLASGREFDARIVGQDSETDLAVIKIDVPDSLPSARMGDSDKLNVGDWVLAIGSPFGLEQTVTAGIISAKDRVTGDSKHVFQQFLQTDAAINPGNSGGPLVNLAGEVVGINTQIATTSGVFNGIGFALPSSTAVEIYNQLAANGRVRRGFLGINPAELTTPLARQFGLKDQQGVLISALTSEDSPAARAGLEAGDVVTAINGEKITNVRQLIRRIASLPVGSLASISYVRDGAQRTATVRLDERPGERTEGDWLSDPQEPKDPAEKDEGGKGPGRGGEKPRFKRSVGITAQTLTPELAKVRGVEGAQGAIVLSVEPGSVAYDRGVENSDVIIEVNRKSIRSLEDYNRAIREMKSGDELVIRVLRKRDGFGPRKLSSVIISMTMP